MKAVILAGGLGTRLSEAELKPKPMVELSDAHFMAHYENVFVAWN